MSKPPTWYNAEDIRQAVRSGNFPPIPEVHIPEIAEHLQKAFDKGFELAERWTAAAGAQGPTEPRGVGATPSGETPPAQGASKPAQGCPDRLNPLAWPSYSDRQNWERLRP